MKLAASKNGQHPDRLVALASALGIDEVDRVAGSVAESAEGSVEVAAPLAGADVVLIDRALGDLARDPGGGGAAELLAERPAGSAVLLVAMDATGPTAAFLKTATRGAITGVVETPGSPQVRYPDDGRPLTRELAGHTLPRDGRPALGLSLADAPPGTRVLMEVGGVPALVYLQVGEACVFVWATDRIVDVESPLTSEKQFEEATDLLVPPLVFFRERFGPRVWHNPHAAAAIVIDDPLIRRRYGMLDFGALVSSALENGYRVTLAFIPWNHRRTRPSDARFFASSPEAFSLCAHGCDHSNNEFSSGDYQDLLRRNHLAGERMAAHSARNGLPCEPVMVCPQEQYSIPGMRAFADSRRFLGLTNTGCLPREEHEPVVTRADLLAPAQDAFFGFPVFKRHYPSEPWKRALSLFLGKPAILVTHHGDFQAGPLVAERFAEEVAAARPGSSWAPLGDLVRRTHWRKSNRDGSVDVRMFTTQFVGRHEPDTPAVYRFQKRLPETVEVSSVSVNGGEVGFGWSGGYLRFEREIREPGPLEVTIEIPPVTPSAPTKMGWKENASTAFRRGMSEFRDTVISRNGPALRTARSFMKSLRMTGGS